MQEIIIIDEKPLRKAALSEIEQANALLDQLKSEWIVYSEKDQSAYSRWLYTEFSPVIGEITHCIRELREKHRLIEAVQEEAELKNIDLSEAYQNVISGKSHRDQPSEEKVQSHDDEWSDEATSDSKFEMPSDSDADGRIRQVYRYLAKILHPDVQAGPREPWHSALWLEVQEAYGEKNLGRLETIAERLKSKQKQSFSLPTIWELRQMISRTIQSIGALRWDLKRARRDRSWGFSKPMKGKRKKKIAQAVQRELEEELREIKQAVAILEHVIAEWLEDSYEQSAS